MKKRQKATGNPQGQVKITRNMIDVKTQANANGGIAFDTIMRFDELFLNDDAIIKLQVVSRSREDIYPMGTVGTPKRRTIDTSAHINPKYRVYICLPDSPRIIAKSVWARIDDEGQANGILPVLPAELDGIFWSLNFDDDELTLLVNKDPDLNVKFEIQNDAQLQAYIIPEIILQILVRLHEKQTEDHAWVVNWKKWIELNGSDLLDSDEDDDDVISDWASDIVSKFAVSHKMISKALISRIGKVDG